MNKLVSKNPILRFKLGKNIVKALNGVVLNILGHKTVLGPSASNFFRTIKKGYNYYNVNSGATKDFNWIHGNTGSPITFLRNVIDGNLKNPNRHSPEELRNRVYLSNTQFVTPKQSTKILNTPKTLIVKPKLVNNIWIKGYNRRPEITDVRAMLLKLLNLGLLQSKYGIDGKWGKDTEAAYQKYLSIKNVPSLEDTIIKANIPESTQIPSTGLLLNEEDSQNFKKFLGGYKQGGSILKFQKGTNKRKVNLSRPKVTVDWDLTQQLKGAKEFVNKTILDVRKVTQPMQQHTEKASKRNKNAAALLLLLWNSGAFNGVIDEKTGKLVTYERAVDGMMGGMTRLAMENNKKRRNAIKINVPELVVKELKKELNNSIKFVTSSGSFAPPQIIEKAATSVKPYVEEAGDFVGHNPALIFMEDADRASSNRIVEALTGKRPFKGRTITSLPTLLQLELINQVKFAIEQGTNHFNPDMYRKMYLYNYGSRNGYEGEDRSGLWARMNSPRTRLEHTLGLYSFYTDENGNTIVTDIYDFNDNLKQGGEGRYVNVRNNIAGTFGSRSSDPLEGKIKYKINLGKI